MTNKPCGVPGCPALALSRKDTCGPHEDARLAKSLGISQTAQGRGGKRCINCGRLFKAEDYVFATMKPRAKVKKAGELYGHAHIACEPLPSRLSRRKIRETEKPLFAGVEG